MYTLMAWLGTGAGGVVVGMLGVRVTARRLRVNDQTTTAGDECDNNLDHLVTT